MATKTFILRPTSNYVGDGMPTIYPNDTDDSMIYLLVSEDIADDDATYIITPKTVIAPFWFNFTVPSGYEGVSPTHCRIICRAKSASTGENLRIGHGLLNDTGDDMELHTAFYTHSFTTANVYENTIIDVDTTTISSVWNMLSYAMSNSLDPEGWFSILPGSSSKSVETRVTQFYIELDYEDNSVEDIPSYLYIKQAGEWELVNNTIYKKINGIWTEKDNSILNNGYKYYVDMTV